MPLQIQLHERCIYFWAEMKILGVTRLVCRPIVEIDVAHRLRLRTLSQYFHPIFDIENDYYNCIVTDSLI